MEKFKVTRTMKDAPIVKGSKATEPRLHSITVVADDYYTSRAFLTRIANALEQGFDTVTLDSDNGRVTVKKRM